MIRAHADRRFVAVAIALVVAATAAAGYVGCGESASPESAQVLVAGAASLRDYLDSATEGWRASDSTAAFEFNIAGSNVLAEQLEHGAPFDVFIPAAESIVDTLVSHGVLNTDDVHLLASNDLVVIGGMDERDTLVRLEDLLKRGGRIAVASPGVPARIYAEESLRAASLWDTLKSRFIFGANVRQVVDYVARGESAYGLVYASDVVPFSDRVRILHRIAGALHRPIRYPIVVPRDAPHRAAALRLERYLLDSTGPILRRYGFQPIDTGSPAGAR